MDNMLVKNATGQDLKNFFIGSEGIFGLITSCRMQLIQKPNDTNIALIGFNDISSLDKITSLIIGFDIEAIEFFTRNSLNQVNREYDYIDIADLDNNYYLIVEFCDQNKFTNSLEEMYKNNLAQEIIISSNNSQKESIWKYRLLISESISRSSPIKFDIAVPVQKTSLLIHELEIYFKKNKSYELILFGHIGDGNLHINVLKKSDEYQDIDNSILEKDLYSIVFKLDGTFSAEHGVGVNKVKTFMIREDQAKIELLKSFKDYFDHNKILNPGKLIE